MTGALVVGRRRICLTETVTRNDFLFLGVSRGLPYLLAYLRRQWRQLD